MLIPTYALIIFGVGLIYVLYRHEEEIAELKANLDRLKEWSGYDDAMLARLEYPGDDSPLDTEPETKADKK